MPTCPPTVIIRHPREKISKCTLQPLVGRPELTFLKAHHSFSFDATDYVLLAMDAPELTSADGCHPLLLLDSTWRLLPRLLGRVTGKPILRTLPAGIHTAYPRISKVLPDPLGGLASVEALYAALRIMGRDDPSLLANYHWAKQFLEIFKVWEEKKSI